MLGKPIKDYKKNKQEMEEWIAELFEIEVKKRMKRCTGGKWELVIGMGTAFFMKDGNIVHNEDRPPHKLPKILKECIDFTDDYDFVCAYISRVLG
jgi:dihydroxyacetone kinase-like predicted kinase